MRCTPFNIIGAPTLYDPIFFVSMSMTQRSEGMNNIVKMKIKSYYTLLEFNGNFESVLNGIREKENILDHKDLYGIPSLRTILGIKKSLCGVYTNQASFDF